MKRTLLVLLAALVALPASLVADRLGDKDLKSLIDRINQEREQFANALDSKLKNGVLRAPTGEMDVSKYLEDFKTNIERLKDRLKPGYSASTEAATVLHQGTAVDGFFGQQPPGTKGGSEWTKLAGDLKSLAAAYGTEFPTPENAAVRRMGDAELAAVTDQIAKGAEALKKSLDADLKKDKSVDAASRQAVVKDAEQIGKDAKVVGDRLNSGTPSSSELERVLVGALRVQTFVGTHNLPTAAGAWKAVSTNLGVLAGAYNAKWPR